MHILVNFLIKLWWMPISIIDHGNSPSLGIPSCQQSKSVSVLAVFCVLPHLYSNLFDSRILFRLSSFAWPNCSLLLYIIMLFNENTMITHCVDAVFMPCVTRKTDLQKCPGFVKKRLDKLFVWFALIYSYFLRISSS